MTSGKRCLWTPCEYLSPKKGKRAESVPENILVYLLSFICNPLHGTQRAMAATPPLP